MKKRSILLSLSCVLILALMIIVYYREYPISNSNESIQSYLNKKYIDSKDALIQKQIDIKDTKVVVFKSNGHSIQYAFFKKGLNGRYHFLKRGSNDGLTYESSIEKIQNNDYLVIFGYNPQNSAYMHVSLSSATSQKLNYSEVFSIKSEKYFIKYKPIINQKKNIYGLAANYLNNKLK